MRRILLPLLLLALAITGFVMADRADETAAEPVERPIESPATPVLSVRRAPELLVLPRARADLENSLAEIVAASPELTCLTVSDGREVLYSHQAGAPALTPASNQKLLTAAAALLELGPQFQFRTEILGAQPIVDGVISGDIYLVGGGDPMLYTPDYVQSLTDPKSDNPTPIEALANDLVGQGLVDLSGAVVGVDSRYDQERYVASWPDRFRTEGQSGPLGALMINDGFVAPYPSPEERLNNVFPTPSSDPALHAASSFDDLLEAQGVIVRSSARTGELPADQDLQVLAAIESPPLIAMVEQLLSGSDNETAELLVKELGLVRQGEGSTAAGIAAVTEILGSAGIEVSESDLLMFDGSGLDGGNRVTCDTLLDVLQIEQLGESLKLTSSIAAERGTLIDRYVGTDVAGRMFAKTGFLNDVSSLSGYVDTLAGEELTFAYVVNAPDGITQEIIDLQTPLGETLVAYPQGPPVESLAPLTVGSEAAPAIPAPDTPPGANGGAPQGDAPTDDGAEGPTQEQAPAATQTPPQGDAPAEGPTQEQAPAATEAPAGGGDLGPDE